MATVLYSEIEPGIGLLTLNDPDSLNAMSEAMAKEFSSQIDQLKKAPPRALILTGAGRAFSAGGDLKMLDHKRSIAPEENKKIMLSFYDAFLKIRSLGVPLIAAINGPAVGAGLCLASGCDLRIASTGAKLGFTFVKLGLHPGMGGTFFLPRLIGHSAALYLLTTGKIILAEEAQDLGLVSEILPPEELMPRAKAIAKEIAAQGPETVKMIVHTLRGDDDISLAKALEREADCQKVSYASAEFAEGIKKAMKG